MGILWHALAARFKQKLSLPDLHEATDQAFEIAATSLPDVFQALRRLEPGIDYGRMWRNDFSPKLEIIAAEHTRQSQAAECRRLIVRASEEYALANALTGAGQALFSRMFFEEDVTSDMSDENVQALVAKHVIFRIADKVALMLLYKQQFNATLSFDSFEDDFANMCKISAEFYWREAGHLLLSSSKDAEREDGWDKLYLEIIQPATVELDSIKQRFKENLFLLSPKKPNATLFYEFKDRALRAMEPYL